MSMQEQRQEKLSAEGWNRRYSVGSRFEVFPVPYVRMYDGNVQCSLDSGVYCHRRDVCVRISEPLYVAPDYTPGHRGCLLTWASGSVFLHFKGLLGSTPARIADCLLDAGLLFDLSHAKDLLAYATACYAEGVRTTPDGAEMVPAGRPERDGAEDRLSNARSMPR